MYLPRSLTLTATDDIKIWPEGNKQNKSRHKQRRRHLDSIRSTKQKRRTLQRHWAVTLTLQSFSGSNPVPITYAWAYAAVMSWRMDDKRVFTYCMQSSCLKRNPCWDRDCFSLYLNNGDHDPDRTWTYSRTGWHDNTQHGDGPEQQGT